MAHNPFRLVCMLLRVVSMVGLSGVTGAFLGLLGLGVADMWFDVIDMASGEPPFALLRRMTWWVLLGASAGTYIGVNEAGQ